MLQTDNRSMRIIALLVLIFTISCSDNSGSADKKPQAIVKDTAVVKRKLKIISDATNILEPGIKNLELEYIIWDCSCANWITTEDRAKYYSKEQVEAHCFYIEPANPSLNLPDSVFQFDKNNIKVTGQFYVREDYPRGTTEIEEPQKKAKVFRYTKIEVTNKKFVINQIVLYSLNPGHCLVLNNDLRYKSATPMKLHSNPKVG
jgi:hypothetical protein